MLVVHNADKFAWIGGFSSAVPEDGQPEAALDRVRH
jgi:hypothetical protein